MANLGEAGGRPAVDTTPPVVEEDVSFLPTRDGPRPSAVPDIGRGRSGSCGGVSGGEEGTVVNLNRDVVIPPPSSPRLIMVARSSEYMERGMVRGGRGGGGDAWEQEEGSRSGAGRARVYSIHSKQAPRHVLARISLSPGNKGQKEERHSRDEVVRSKDPPSLGEQPGSTEP